MGTYLKADLEVSANWTLIDGTPSSCRASSCCWSPAHAEGLQCLQLELDNLGTVLLTSDACYTELNWGPPMRPAGVLDDSKAYFRIAQETARHSRGHERHRVFRSRHSPV